MSDLSDDEIKESVRPLGNVEVQGESLPHPLDLTEYKSAVNQAVYRAISRSFWNGVALGYAAGAVVVGVLWWAS